MRASARWSAALGVPLVCCLALPATTMAAAPAEDFVSLPLSVSGTVADYVVEAVHEALQEELARAELPMRTGSPDTACADSACAGRAADAAGVALAVRAHLEQLGPDHTLTIEVVDVEGQVVASVSETCDTCGRDELVAMTTDLATKTRRKLDAQQATPPTLRVESTPPGARVELEGEVLGTTPLEVQVPVGTYDLVIEARGHISTRQRVTFVEGVEEHRSVVLERLPEPVRGGPGHRLRIGGWSSLGAGAASLATGVALFAVDEREITSDCSGDNVDAAGNCRWRWNATPGAVAFTVVGGAAVVAGAVMLGMGYQRKRAAEGRAARVEPRLGGFALRF